MFSKKTTTIEKIFTVHLTLTYLANVKSAVKIWSIFVSFLENMSFTDPLIFLAEGISWLCLTFTI